MTLLALDKVSTRRMSVEGHLHVDGSTISVATVDGYLGREIPEWDVLGLKPNKIYKLLRDPTALAEGAASFENKPLVVIHKPLTAEDHDKTITVGAVSNIRWEPPRLVADLAIWDQSAIDLVENDTQRDISCGYRYRCAMEPGSYQGVAYDGKMVDIVGNHVALVKEGRVHGAFVGDSAPLFNKEIEPMAQPSASVALSRKALLASGAIRAYLVPKMAKDQKIPDVMPLISDVTAKNWKEMKPKVVARLKQATVGKLAMDADMSDAETMMDGLDDTPEAAKDEFPVPPPVAPVPPVVPDAAAGDLNAKIAAILGPNADPAMVQALCALMTPAAPVSTVPGSANDTPPPTPGAPKPPAPPFTPIAKDDEMVPKAAMDAAIKKSQDEAVQATLDRLNAIREAENDIRPYVGTVPMALDSAVAVYKFALDGMKVDTTGVEDVRALKLVLNAQPKPGSALRGEKPKIGMDEAKQKSFAQRFPNAGRLKV